MRTFESLVVGTSSFLDFLGFFFGSESTDLTFFSTFETGFLALSFLVLSSLALSSSIFFLS